MACYMTRETPMQGMRESRRLIDALGWAVVLPQMLGMLGLVFSDAGVGKAVAYVTTSYINMDIRFVAVAVYVLGMALATQVEGIQQLLRTALAVKADVRETGGKLH